MCAYDVEQICLIAAIALIPGMYLKSENNINTFLILIRLSKNLKSVRVSDCIFIFLNFWIKLDYSMLNVIKYKNTIVCENWIYDCIIRKISASALLV